MNKYTEHIILEKNDENKNKLELSKGYETNFTLKENFIISNNFLYSNDNSKFL